MECSCYDFDRTKISIHGHSLKVGIGKQPGIVYYNAKKEKLDKIEGKQGDLLRVLNSYFKANVTLKFYPSTVTVNKYGRPEGFLIDAASGQIDFAINSLFIRDYWKMQSVPLYTDSKCIVSQKQSIDLFDELGSIIITEICLIFIIINLISTLAIKCIMKLSFSAAGLEFIRIFTGSALITKPKLWSEKFFFITLVILANSISSFFLSSLDSLKTEPSWKIINSIDDLNKSNVTVYVKNSYVDLLPRMGYKGNFKVTSDFNDCYDQILKGKYNAACLSSCFVMKLKFDRNKLVHIAEDTHEMKPFIVLVTSIDWPLYKKFNFVLQRLVDSGIAKWLENYHMYRYSEKNQTSKFEQSVDNSDIYVAYYLLAGGLSIAILIFSIEFFYKLRPYF